MEGEKPTMLAGAKGRSPARNMNAARVATLALVLILAPPVRADSVFSAQGLGEIVTPTDMRGRGMGGTSIAVPDPWNMSPANPAILAQTRGFILHGEIMGERRSISDRSGGDYTGKSTTFPLLRLAVDVPKAGTLGFGVEPWAVVDYEFINLDTSTGSLVRQVFRGEDGLSMVTFTFARRLQPRLDFGVDLDLPIGSYADIYETRFADPNFVDTNDSLVVNIDRSLILRLGVAGNPHRRLRAGGALTLGRNVGTRTEIRGSVDDPQILQESELHLPTSLALGVCGDLTDQVRVAADVTRTWWGGTELTTGDDPLIHRTNIETRDVTRFGIGIEYQGDRSPEAFGFRRRMPLRAGYSTTPWHFRDGYGEDIRDHVFSVGAGLPIGGTGGGIAQVAFELGFRGDRERNGASERFYRLGLAFGVREIVPVSRVPE